MDDHGSPKPEQQQAQRQKDNEEADPTSIAVSNTELLKAISDLTAALREHTNGLEARSEGQYRNQRAKFGSSERPLWLRVAREHVEERALNEKGYPWEYEEDDKRWILIRRNLSRRATDELFARTKELRGANASTSQDTHKASSTGAPAGNNDGIEQGPAVPTANPHEWDADKEETHGASTVENEPDTALTVKVYEFENGERQIRMPRDFLEMETLSHFHIMYTLDKDDSRCIIFKGNTKKPQGEEIDELFAHTAAIRNARDGLDHASRDLPESVRAEIDELHAGRAAMRRFRPGRRRSSSSSSSRFRRRSVSSSDSVTPRHRVPGASVLQDWKKPTVMLSTNSKAVKRLQEIKTPFGPKHILPAPDDNPYHNYAARIEKESWLQRMSNHGIFSTFESTQYMVLHHIQNRVSRETSHIMSELKTLESYDDSSPHNIDDCFSRLDKLLETYFNALRRLRWSMDQTQPSWSAADQYIVNQVDQFNGTGPESSWFHDKSAFMDITRPGEKADALRMLLVKHLPISLTATDRERMQALQKVWKEGTVKPEQTHLPTGFNGFIDRLVRFTAAMVGASMLLVPVIVMIYVTDQHWRLGITCFAAVICALFLAFLTDSEPRDVFGGTAGYVGLLIVFLGVSS